MPEVRRRRATTTTRPTSRRRDRAAEIEEDDEELEDEEDVDAAAEPVRKTRRSTTKKTTTRRRPAPVEDEDEEDEDDYDEEDEEEEEPPPPRRARAATKKASTRRRPPVDEDDEEEEEDERPRRSSRATKKAAPKTKLAGVRTGLKGAEEVNQGGSERLTLGKEPVLIKCLEREPLVSFKQHWPERGRGQANIPYTCPRPDAPCPLCDGGDTRPSKATVFNVLYFPLDAPPENRTLTLAVRAYGAFKSAATPRNREVPLFDRNFFAINKSGKGNQQQTNFKMVKLEDLEEDWAEILEFTDLDDIGTLDEKRRMVDGPVIEEAREHLFSAADVVEIRSLKELREVARHLVDDDEDEDE